MSNYIVSLSTDQDSSDPIHTGCAIKKNGGGAGKFTNSGKEVPTPGYSEFGEG